VSTKGMIKLTSVSPTPMLPRIMEVLESELRKHHVDFVTQNTWSGAKRYFVKTGDYCCANTILIAVRGLFQ
jgi:hypothetical protein